MRARPCARRSAGAAQGQDSRRPRRWNAWARGTCASFTPVRKLRNPAHQQAVLEETKTCTQSSRPKTGPSQPDYRSTPRSRSRPACSNLPHDPGGRAEIARSIEPTGVLPPLWRVHRDHPQVAQAPAQPDCQCHSSRPHKLPWKATEEEPVIVCALRCDRLSARLPDLRGDPLTPTSQSPDLK